MKATINDIPLLMHKAVIDNDSEYLDKLIKYGYDINNVDSRDKTTALHLAVKKGGSLLVKQLLQHKASVEVYNKTGYTPLHLACHHEHDEIVSELVKYGARPNVINVNGNTPLHLAVQKKNSGIVNILLNANADVDFKGCKGYTPLMLSSSLGDYKTTLLLISQGAELSIKMSDNGPKAYDIAVQKSYLEIIELMNITSASDLFNTKQNKENIFLNSKYIIKLVNANDEIKTAFTDRIYNFNIKKFYLKDSHLNTVQLELNRLYSNLNWNVTLVSNELKEDISFLERFRKSLHSDGSGFISLYKMCGLIHYDKILNPGIINNLPKEFILDTFATLSNFKANNEFYNESLTLLGTIYNNFEEDVSGGCE